MPWVVPPAELLYYCGELDQDYIGDAVDADWIRCATMGSTRPKPDYCAGLLAGAYTQPELAALQAYASAQRPVFFTPELSFPFLVCEAKTGETGLNQADRQNIHSASIAVRAIVELFKTAFGVQDTARVTDLYGRMIVFSVSHDNDRAQVYGHFCVQKEAARDDLEFYRYPITLVSLSAAEGVDKGRIYSFIRNVYDHFVPEHLQRIKTGITFSTSELGLGEAGSQELDGADECRVPGTPASTIESEQMRRLILQMEQQKRSAEQHEQLMEQQKRQMQEQMEHQKRQMQEQMEQQKRQMEQQMEHMNNELRKLREPTHEDSTTR
ncbi:Hypothetical protein D9617_51g088930 [Elsinoe fawcettii]|nr:Hypothetical protein D9617_51g088930 [Elsinoe fawcettii]